MSFQIRPHLEQAKRLIAAGDERSLVYAALELRLGVELICYEKLRMRLNYISQLDIRDWRPKQVLEALVELVDPRLCDEALLHVAEEPIDEEPKTWLLVCKKDAMNPRRLSRIWNKLGNFLHVQLPTRREHAIKAYPDVQVLATSLLSLVDELETLTSGGDLHFPGRTTHFYCSCGARVERPEATLRDGQFVSCINPSCGTEYVVRRREDGSFGFPSNVIELVCRRCEYKTAVLHKDLREMHPGQDYAFDCSRCGAAHSVRCRFDYGLAPDPPS